MKWLLILLFVIGCGVPRVMDYHYTRVPYHSMGRVVPVYVDKNFGEADKVLIGEAVAQWNYALNGFIDIQVVDSQFDMDLNVITHLGAGWIIFKVDSLNPVVGGHKPSVLAFADKVGGSYVYVIRDRVYDNWLRGVMMHEIGHLLGAGHVAGLMNDKFYWQNTRCVDYPSIKEVAKYQHLPLNELNYCEYQ